MVMSQRRIIWPKLDEVTFNDLVESLLVREFTRDGMIAMAVDGRGGDGGIDVDVRARRTEQLIHVFQLKYFPEGFSGGHVNRRSQIQGSLLEALKLTPPPPLWTLVVPRKVTVKERQAVRKMRKGHPVRIEFMTPPELDNLLAKHPDIERRFTIDREVEILSVFKREEAALVKAGDLRSELNRMSDRLHGRSEYWGAAFSVGPDGTPVESFFPKRADAGEREPLGLNLTLGFSPDDNDLKKRFEMALKFGPIEPVKLPARVIQSLEKVGPEWFSETLEGIALQLGPAGDAHLPLPVRVDVRDESDHVRATLRGTTTALAAGYGGTTVDVKLEGGVSQRWMLPSSVKEPGSVTFETSFIGSSARDIRRALRFLERSDGAGIFGLSVDGAKPILLTFAPSRMSPHDPRFVAFIDDLCFLEDHFELSLHLPAQTDRSDLLWARIMRLLIEGYATAHPFNRTYGATLDGTRDPGLDMLLSDGQAAVIQESSFALQLFGERLEIDRIAYYSHHVLVDEASTARDALANGTAAGMKISLRPIDGLPWVIYVPAALEASGRTTVITQPWNLEGLSEHPGYSRLPNRLGNQSTVEA
ncbi:hypothetical protein G3N18_05925 [Microbacterium sp. 2C]|uniref:hypothetical protein n=1 Tax=Microbacterium paulum TaxID=2707006 RepID=UPI0018C31E65|nr:hypothetical protein [Microbacterium paulum]MBG0717619.1 hypothetical protein [Microbacterium paulum]